MTEEIKRACTFLINQIKKGWTAEEAFQQVQNAYGQFIADCVLYYMKRNLKPL